MLVRNMQMLDESSDKQAEIDRKHGGFKIQFEQYDIRRIKNKRERTRSWSRRASLCWNDNTFFWLGALNIFAFGEYAILTKVLQLVFTSDEIKKIDTLHEMHNLQYLFSITYMDINKGYFMTSLVYLFELILRQVIKLVIMYLYVLNQETKLLEQDTAERYKEETKGTRKILKKRRQFRYRKKYSTYRRVKYIRKRKTKRQKT